MKRGLVVVLAIMTSCLPSTSDYARGTPTDAGVPEASTPVVDAGTPEASTMGEAGVVDAGVLPKSCKDVTTTVDGYVTTTHGAVFCNMTIDGGGWTMVGRSHDEEDGADQYQAFGWVSASGAAQDTNHPYSLGVLTLDFDFTQVLLAKVNDADTMDLGQTFELALTKTELLANANTTTPVDAITTVKGSCRPSGGPSMFANEGFTSTTNQFHFRDVTVPTDAPSDQYGLLWYGFETNYPNCNQGGELESQGGAIFVR